MIGHNIASTPKSEVIQLRNMASVSSVTLYQTTSTDNFVKWWDHGNRLPNSVY